MLVRKCIRETCENSFIVIPSDTKKYCSLSCAAKVNNKGQIFSEERKSKIAKAHITTGLYARRNRFCLYCNVLLKNSQLKYCSVKCHVDYQYSKYIKLWKSDVVDGNRGITTRYICLYIRRYLIEKFKNKCSQCGWNQIHPMTKKVMVEIEHIDGNSENNTENNLTLLCPNCHALTPFYKNLNKGNGRKWRMKKYIKNL
jgi:hypothetical protein